MSARHHDTLDQLLHDMLEHENMVAQRVERSQNSRNNITNFNTASRKAHRLPSSASITDRPAAVNLRSNTSTGTQGQGQATSKDLRCYNCQNFGHLSRDCPQPRRDPYCPQCKGFGHIRSRCPANRPTSTINCVTQNSSTTVGKYLKTASLNGIELNAFVDMGSSDCLIKASTALINQMNIIYQPVELRSFGPEDFKTLSPGYITATIKVDEASVTNIPVWVVPDDRVHSQPM